MTAPTEQEKTNAAMAALFDDETPEERAAYKAWLRSRSMIGPDNPWVSSYEADG